MYAALRVLSAAIPVAPVRVTMLREAPDPAVTEYVMDEANVNGVESEARAAGSVEPEAPELLPVPGGHVH
jgi:hypothetical protein